MAKRKTIIGAGGGGGKGGGGGTTQVPTEAPNTLRSKSYARVLDLIGEGEIEGIQNGLQGVYLNETPIQNPNGTYNFSGVQFDSRTGTQTQPALTMIPSAESETAMNVQVPYNGSQIFSVTDEDVTHVRVTIGIPQLTYQDPRTGNLTGTATSFNIYLQSNGGGYVKRVSRVISGKTLSRYQESWLVQLTGDGPWDIKVENPNAEPAANYQNKLFLDSYTECIYARFQYPNSALMALRIDASQFSSVPSRAYDVKLLRIRIPSNATVRSDGSLTYSGSWDGTFQTAWSSNPAWCFYDLLTAERYGLGGFLEESQIDKWALYEIGRYCDELVPNGFGSTEPRFTCNLYIQSRQEAFKVIQDMASVFRGMVYWSGGTLTATQDAPADPVYLYSPANVVDGLFSYSGASLKARHSVAVVAWNDPEDFYRQKYEYVEDANAISRFGIIETQVYAIGCTSRGQAARVGRWLLYTEQYESETVTFRTGVEGAVCRPGHIVSVADPVRAGSRLGGRVVSATTTTVTLDAIPSINVVNGTLYVVLEDGSVESRQIQSTAGATITVASAFTSAPAAQSMWLADVSAARAQLFRVVQVTEEDDGTFEVTGVAHDPQKYAVVENGVKLEPRDISVLSLAPGEPIDPKLTESLYEDSGQVKVKLTVSWQPSLNATAYAVQYRIDDGNFVLLPQTSANDIDILDALTGFYEVTVTAISAIGKRSLPVTVTGEVVGKVAPPGDVEDFSLLPSAGYANLQWTRSTDLDVLIGGSVRIRHSPVTSGATWANSVDVVPALPGNATRAQAPLLSGSYLIKFIDSSGVSSENETTAVTTVADLLAFNVVDTLTESPSFPGAKTNVEIEPDTGYLTLSSDGLIDDYLGDIDDLGSFDFLGGVASGGTYEFDDEVGDLGAVFTSRITANIEVEAFETSNFVDTWVDVDDLSDIDGGRIDDVDVILEMRTTEDDPAGSPVWTSWKPFIVNDYSFRAIEFRLRLVTATSTHNIRVKTLEVTVDMPDRVANLRGLSSGAGVYNVVFPEGFYETPSVGVTANDMLSGDYYEITNQTNLGFDIVFKSSGGSAVSRNFDVLAKGYGRAV